MLWVSIEKLILIVTILIFFMTSITYVKCPNSHYGIGHQDMHGNVATQGRKIVLRLANDKGLFLDYL